MAYILFTPILMAIITSASMLTGCQFSLSYVSLPTVLQTPPDTPEHLILAQFKTSFLRGFHLCPMNAIPTSVVCLLNAILTYWYGDTKRALLLLVAGAFIVGIVPFTLRFIVPLEETLLKKNAEVQKARGAQANEIAGEKIGAIVVGSDGGVPETRKQIEEWVRLNYIRTIFPAIGVAVAWSLW
ncbi:uncharacterized protein KY384_006780 [Bacidia gigantensis]|uniref:uncharacterized protein n=1 Tax=Bacidia gigantensis TaxID=2732470 RepID=UPI001D04796F|nr:uncharacterized protein KY384_006780 [Bacidia gigantensis]KAG8527864.1 hypothetical protein KY384_006780 [Bacidia gigantensis]